MTINDLNDNRMAMNYQQALKVAAGICSRSEKCRADIVASFRAWGLSQEEINEGIDFLMREKFIDEERYAKHFVHDKFRLNKWGKVKIAYMLRTKHIPAEIIERALDSVPIEDYESTLRSLLLGKIKTIKSINDRERKAKLVFYAQQRGFENEIAFVIAGEIDQAVR